MKASISAGGKLPDVLIWYQGEADPGSEATYIAKLANLLARVRAFTGKPALRMFVIELAKCGLPEDSYAGIRSKQREFADTDDCVLLVPSADLAVYDAAHLTRWSQFLLALRIHKIMEGAFK